MSMKRYRRIAVALNLSDQDTTTLKYASLFVRIAAPDSLDVIHIVSQRGMPAGVLHEDPELPDQALAAAVATLDAHTLRDLDTDESLTVRKHVLHGLPIYDLLRFARKKEPDLIIAGRDPDARHSGTLPERLARKAPCSVLVVPRGVPARVGNILVPVDFSSNAASALETAIAIGTRVGVEEILCLHAYRLPQGYSKLGKSEEEFGRILKANAKLEFDKFCAKIDSQGIDLRCEYIMEDYTSRAVFNAVENRDINLVVVGARGRSTGASFLLGSTTARLINSTRVPVLAVKAKGSNLSLLDALLAAVGRE